jgi:arginase
MNYVVIEAPSILGLWPSGVEMLPEALKRQGLVERLGALQGASIPTPEYNRQRDTQSGLLNGPGIARHARDLAAALEPVWHAGNIPVVLGGDCSVLVGAALGLKRRGRHGLLFVDGHADYYGAKESPTGEVADMDFAVVTGAGHPLIGNIDGLAPYFDPTDTVAVGARDHQYWTKDGSQDIRTSGTALFDLPLLRRDGMAGSLAGIKAAIERPGLEGIWVHFDADALDDAVMPAVDYRLDGGLSIDEATEIIRVAKGTGRFKGISVTIFNPKLDPDGTVAARLTDCLIAGLVNGQEH